MTHVVALASGMSVGRLYMPSSNSHIYENCYDLARELISKPAKRDCQLDIDPEWNFDIDSLSLESFTLLNYEPGEAMKVEVN